MHTYSCKKVYECVSVHNIRMCELQLLWKEIRLAMTEHPKRFDSILNRYPYSQNKNKNKQMKNQAQKQTNKGTLYCYLVLIPNSHGELQWLG